MVRHPVFGIYVTRDGLCWKAYKAAWARRHREANRA